MPMRQIKPEDPTPVTVSNTIPAGTAGNSAAKAATVSVVSIAIGTDGGTGDAGMVSWINPESSTILVTNAFLRWTTTGTGTFDLGVSDDGTGSSDNLINGGEAQRRRHSRYHRGGAGLRSRPRRYGSQQLHRRQDFGDGINRPRLRSHHVPAPAGLDQWRASRCSLIGPSG